MELIIILTTILAGALTARYYQVKCKHAMKYYQFEKDKHNEYRNAYDVKQYQLEQLQTIHQMLKFEKKQALTKVEERNDLQLKLDRANATIEKVHKLLDSGAKGQETLAALIETGEYRKNK